MNEELENHHAGKPGKPGEPGNSRRGGAGGTGGEGGEGGETGGEGGTGGTGGEMSVGPRGPRGPSNPRALIGYLILSAGVIIALWVGFQNDNDAEDQRDTLCRNQASIVQMQRLFLAEHANIRLQLMDAGIPNEHADPDILDKLKVLIEAADCKVDNLEGGDK